MRLPSPRLLPLSLLLVIVIVILIVIPPSARAAEPFFRKGDVIALVGGEDMVVASEYGYLELLLTRALPDYHLRFRNLAWEGDTVFEQRRDLNFPTWEEQLDKIGATVVICQFGQMESLAGKEKLPEFIAAYEKLIERFSAGGKRQVVLISPLQSMSPPNTQTYSDAIGSLATKIGAFFVRMDGEIVALRNHQRDAIHLDTPGQIVFAMKFTAKFMERGLPGRILQKDYKPIQELIIAKNRLWFDYWRPQNWAFLAGDRTAQPSSRDHLDPSKRWFPPEREAFLPLIEAKEKEIDALAAKLAGQ